MVAAAPTTQVGHKYNLEGHHRVGPGIDDRNWYDFYIYGSLRGHRHLGVLSATDVSLLQKPGCVWLCGATFALSFADRRHGWSEVRLLVTLLIMAVPPLIGLLPTLRNLWGSPRLFCW